MKYLSACSGIEAATVAWQPLGWQAVAFSEIEKFPNAVLDYHYDVPNWGDVNDFKNWPKASVDVLVGGTPCQSFSVAGLRAGLADPRGDLTLDYLAIAARYSPEWLVWENVPGVLSSNEGRDFGAIIGAMVELGYGVAWRVLDAQYFGVPQRRRRVFVVGCLGDWRRAAEVLFEPESLRRHPAPRRETGKDIAGPFGGSSQSGGFRTTDLDNQGAFICSPDVSPAMKARDHKGPSSDGDGDGLPLITHTLSAEGCDASEDGTGRGTPIIVHGAQDPDISLTANRVGRNSGLENCAFAQNQRDEVRTMDKAGALAAEPGAKQQTYVFKQGQGAKAGSIGGSETTAPTLGAGQSGTQLSPALLQNMAVRRLTPLECERLQGFPDGYTDIPGASDTARYKALGNSMAVPVMRWIGERIDEVRRPQPQ